MPFTFSLSEKDMAIILYALEDLQESHDGSLQNVTFGDISELLQRFEDRLQW